MDYNFQRGLGGPRPEDGQNHLFYVVSDRGEPQLPDALYRINKYCS